MIKVMLRTASLFAVGVALTACGGEPAAEKSARRTDTPAYQGADNPFVAGGWKPGDATSWEQQMRTRAQGQNEYSRTASGG